MLLHFFTRILMVTQLYMLQHVHTGLRQSLSYWMLVLTLHGITMIFSHPSLRQQNMDSMRKFFSYRFHDLSQHQILTGNSSQHNLLNGIMYCWSSPQSSYGNLLRVQLSTNLLYTKCTGHFILSCHPLHCIDVYFNSLWTVTTCTTKFNNPSVTCQQYTTSQISFLV